MMEEKIVLERFSDSVLVIGGGIAGVQASLDLANQERKVYLVEKTPSLGGVMAQLDKTFPTNESSIYLLEPKLVECGRHSNIELLTYSEVKEVKGKPGDFTVKIERKPRYVREDRCNGCGLCAEVCKIKVPNEFDLGLGARKAIYVPFPQAVPLIYTLDREHCIQCGQCKMVCGRDAIDYDVVGEEMEIRVGSIIVAIGGGQYEPYDLQKYGYDRYPNVITALEFERLLSTPGPTKGKLLRPSDGKEVRKLVFVQCVGCRNKDRPYCSRTCCMHTTKEAIAAMESEKSPEVNVFYTDIRIVGKNFEEYYQRARTEHNINYIKGIPGKIEQKDTGNLIIKYTDQKERKFKKMEVDLVVLSTAITPSKDIDKLAEKLGIEIDEYGFIKELDPISRPIDTIKPGIYACGVATAPRDITDSVAQASGAAAKASLWVRPSKAEKEHFEEVDVRDEEPRVGVFVCNCGVNIGRYVDVPSVAEYAATLPNVVHAEYNAYTCPAESILKIKGKMEEYNLNRLVIASCACCSFEDFICSTCTYQRVKCKKNILEAWESPYPPEFINIREQCPWVHMHEHEKATKKAKDIVRTAVAKVMLVEPHHEKEVVIYPSSLVIGAGISGMTAALNIAYHGFKVHLVEKTGELGGLTKEIDTLPPYDIKSSELLDPIRKKVREEKNIVIHTSTTIKDILGYVGNFEVILDKMGKEEKITVGTIVVATGAKPLEPKGMYGYGKYENVVTQFELEKLLAENRLNSPRNVVMIQCVGAREKEGRTYCSRVCCTMAIKTARQLKRQFPDANIHILHRGIMTVGKTEEAYYLKSIGEGVRYIRYDPKKPPVVKENEDKTLRIEIYDETLGRTIDSDMIVLSTPLTPNEDNKELSKILKVPLDQHGFFLERHPKLGPLEFATDGIFMCGTTHSPKDIADSVSQANGAASKALGLLSKESIKIKTVTAEVDPEKCIACEACLDLCPYGAPHIEYGKAKIIDVLCKGCGACAVSCPTRAITLHQFKGEYYMAQIPELLAEW